MNVLPAMAGFFITIPMPFFKIYGILSMMDFKPFQDKKILILGFGREGTNSFRFLRRAFPNKVIGVGDRLDLEKIDKKYQKILKNDNNVVLHFGKNYLKSIKNYDLIIKSPGVPLETIKPFVTKKQKITSQTEIFLKNCPGTTIGITGTKGKSTTTSLIHAVLKTGKIRAYLVGNIGKPVLSYLAKAQKNDVFVYEMSSHHLNRINISPHIAVFLNIYPEHLDYYKNFTEYSRAKQNITLYQTKQDYFIYNASNKLVSETARKTKAKRISFGEVNSDCRIENGYIFYGKENIFEIKNSPFAGEFYLADIMPAIIVGRLYRIPAKTITQAIKKFKPLRHRLEKVGTYKGITFINDSLATIPEATISAIDSLGENLQTIILGGFERNISFGNLAKKVLGSSVENVILFPTTGEKIWKEISLLIKKGGSKRKINGFDASSMADAVKLAYKHTRKGKTCLLSCASSSFNLFRDYKERGDLFRKYVKEFAKNQ